MDGKRLRLRPLPSVLLASGYSALSALAITLVLAVTFRELVGGDPPGDATFWLMTWGPAVLVFLWGVGRVAIDVSDEGMIVTNVWRTHRLHWENVVEVRNRGGWRSPLAWAQMLNPLVITTTDGHRVLVQASMGFIPSESVRTAIRRAIPRGARVRWKMTFREEM